MRFCTICDNMLYIRTGNEDTVYVCKMCDNVEPLSDGGAVVISETDKASEDMAYRRYLTPLLKHDVTLPHVVNITCPSKECSKAPEVSNDVIVVKYNADKLKFLYKCVYCDFTWRN